MSKLTVDECKRIIMQGKKQLTAAEQRIAELEASNGSRWFELFGTPEKAARTIIKTCDETTECEACPIFRADINALNVNCSDYDALLEWLRGDA